MPAEDLDTYEYPGTGRMAVLIRWHGADRLRLFTPQNTSLPISLNSLTGERRTLVSYVDGTWDILDDVWTDPVRSRLFLERRWQGRTELRVDVARLPGAEFEAASRAVLQRL